MFLVFFILFVIFALFLIFTKIKITIEQLKISNLNINNKIKVSYIIKISLILFSKIKLYELKINKVKANRYINIVKNKVSFKNYKDINLKDKIKIIKNLNLKINKFKLNLNIGTKNVLITPILVAGIASIISLFSVSISNNLTKKNYYYKINPIYNNNVINLQFDSIVSFRIIDILSTFYLYLKAKSKTKNVR